MKNLVFYIWVCCLAVGQALAQQPFQGVVAHRAGIYEDPAFPENSVAALRKSAALGVNMIEIDVLLSKDHQVVVNHDHDFQGLDIASSTFQDLKAKGKLSNGEQLSSLEAYIREIAKHKGLGLLIDIKRSNVSQAWDALTGQYVAEIIRKTQSESFVAVIAPMFPALVKIKIDNPKVKIYYIGVDYSPETLKVLGFDGVNLQYKRYQSEYDMKALQDAGLAVGAYVVDDAAIMNTLLDQQVDFITTNKPWILMDVLKTRKQK
ncbi:glycerophosphodiester phosphodiesterase [Sphingobacterium humi]|uniref:GP-PDE domain-containing protein n=1 Tax=Sphingobacterium humi TaxID=1796905 RepID=A0A6N8L6E3_9SPHI|nr:glycerophosphodiester phosphodiesterase family protein [Sphingobacterium humi]MVZ64031.1 hypothetical protein [Sphingobacterium humi]